MREKIYLNRLEELIKNYQFDLPLSQYLKKEFHRRRNMGSRDRRRTREDVFSFFRIGQNYKELHLTERIAIASYIFSSAGNPEIDYMLSHHSKLTPDQAAHSLADKLNKIVDSYAPFDLNKVFPFNDLLTDKINKNIFLESFLEQPRLWIRVKNGFMDTVISELNEKNVKYQTTSLSKLAISFANSTPVHELNSYAKGLFEIQDLNSQLTIMDFPVKPSSNWWDACAGSGGKTLALLDREPTLNMTASDIREGSLVNLKLRLEKAEHRKCKIIPMDLNQDSLIPSAELDGIIADVPCSGSGTWARNPEQVSSFSSQDLSNRFIPLQRNIVKNLTHALKDKSQLIYITCSVFTGENEDNIRFFESDLGLKCISEKYLEGSTHGADSMFVAVLEKA